jgi:hypothetical protein
LIALITAGIFFCLRHRRRHDAPDTDLAQPVVYAKPEPPTSSVSSSPPPVYPASPISPQNSFYPQVGQAYMIDAFGRPLPMNPAGEPINTGFYPPPAQGVSAYAPPFTPSVSGPTTPANPYQQVPRQTPTELSGEYTRNAVPHGAYQYSVPQAGTAGVRELDV